MEPPTSGTGDFEFLSHHGKTLLLMTEHPELNAQDLEDRLEMSGRAARIIVADLVGAGYLVHLRRYSETAVMSPLV